jgi:phage antirepressor YoqD-like protein
MCEALRRDGFLVRQDCVDYNTPTQDAMERGVFYHTKQVKEMAGGLQATTNVTRVTGRGQQILLQHFQRKHASAGERAA